MNMLAPATLQGFMVCHSVVLLHIAMCISIPVCRVLFIILLSVGIHADPIHWLSCEETFSYSCDCCVNAQGLVSARDNVKLSACSSLYWHRSCQVHLLFGQYFSTPSSTTSLVCGCPLTMYILSICSPPSSSGVAFMSSMDMHIDASTVGLILCIPMLIPDISWSWLYTWLWCDSQSANTVQDLVCTAYADCTGVCTAWCAETTVTTSQHLCWSWP